MSNVDVKRASEPGGLPRLMGEFEREHAVENFQASGWHVWPLLRNSLCKQVAVRHVSCPTTSGADRPAAHGVSRQLLSRIGGRIQRWRSRFVDETKASAALSDCDALLFESTLRNQQIAGQWRNTVCTPVADLMEAEGVRCAFWSQDSQDRLDRTRLRPTVPVMASVHREWTQTGGTGRGGETAAPPWFSEYVALHERLLGVRPNWSDYAWRFAYVDTASRLFERWLDGSSINLLVLDCWYSWEMMAACLAAHRLGIEVVDVQHGLQEPAHFAYHYWTREPPGGFSARPDLYWVWSSESEDAHRTSNALTREVLIGGNPWVSQWQRADEPALKQEIDQALALTEGRYSILVTANYPSGPIWPQLKQLIAGTPREWLWMVRLHPADPADTQALITSLAAGDRQVEFEQASRRPLYALLNAVDLHVTHSSACANEALAFGIPTVLLSEKGTGLFRKFVDGGVMFDGQDGPTFTASVEKANSLDRRRVQSASESVFAAFSHGHRAAGRLAQLALGTRRESGRAAASKSRNA